MHAVASRLIIKNYLKLYSLIERNRIIKNSQSFGKNLTREKKETQDTWHKQGDCGEANLLVITFTINGLMFQLNGGHTI